VARSNCTWIVWKPVFSSYKAGDASMNPGALANLSILKSSLLVFAAAVLLRGLGIIARGPRPVGADPMGTQGLRPLISQATTM